MSKGRAAQRVGTKRGCASPGQLTPTAVLPGGAGVHLTLLAIAVLGQGFWAKEFQSPNPQRP